MNILQLLVENACCRFEDLSTDERTLTMTTRDIRLIGYFEQLHTIDVQCLTKHQIRCVYERMLLTRQDIWATEEIRKFFYAIGRMHKKGFIAEKPKICDDVKSSGYTSVPKQPKDAPKTRSKISAERFYVWLYADFEDAPSKDNFKEIFPK